MMMPEEPQYKRTDRKEIQRRHRERVKQAKEQTEQQLSDLRHEAEQLRAENTSLEFTHSALTLLDQYSEELLTVCKSCQASRDRNPVAEANVIKELESFVSRSLEKDEFPPESWFREVYLKFPPSVLLAMERSYFNSVDRLMTTWRASPSSRESIEKKLILWSSARRRIGLMMLEMRPEIHEKIMSNVLPSISTIIPSNQTIAMVDSLEISKEQAQAMLPAWLKFNEQMQSLQSQSDEARRLLFDAASQASASRQIVANTEMAFLDSCQQKQATRLLNTTQATLFLAAFQKKLMAAYGILAIQICGELTAVQHAKLLLHCDPCLPDYLQICTYLVEPLKEKSQTLTS